MSGRVRRRGSRAAVTLPGSGGRCYAMSSETETPTDGGSVPGCDAQPVSKGTDRVAERRRAIALVRHYREYQGLSIRQIADRLGRSPPTVKAYFYDPTGETARAVKAATRASAAAAAHARSPGTGRGPARLQRLSPRRRSSAVPPIIRARARGRVGSGSTVVDVALSRQRAQRCRQAAARAGSRRAAGPAWTRSVGVDRSPCCDEG